MASRTFRGAAGLGGVEPGRSTRPAARRVFCVDSTAVFPRM